MLGVAAVYPSAVITVHWVLHACRLPKGCKETGREDVSLVSACCSGQLLHGVGAVLPGAAVLVPPALRSHRSTRSTAHARRGVLPPE